MGGITHALGSVANVFAAAPNIIAGQKPPDPKSQVNSLDPRLTGMRDQQIKAATEYGNNIKGYEKQQQNTAADTSRQNLAGQLAGVNTNSNSRGLLYGGYNEGEQAKTSAMNQAALQQQYSNINTNAQNTLSGLQNQALGTGLVINQTQQNQNDLAYQAALQQQMQNNQMFGSLLGGIGSIGGRMAAG